MIVVVEYFVEWPAINDGLVALETFALFSFERFDRDRAKLDPLHRAPRLRVSFQDLDPIKAGVLKGGQETIFGKRTGYAAAPQLWIVLHFFGHLFIAHDVANHRVAAFFQNPKDFFEQLSF